jgi:hypothetical protein
MRSRTGLHESDTCADEILGAPCQRALTRAQDRTRISFQVPVRVVGVLVDGSAPEWWARARAPEGDWFELPCEPLAELGGVRLPRATLLVSELELAAEDAEQIEIHVDYEVHALHDFARVRGLDFQALAYGRKSFDTFHGYRLLGASPGGTLVRVEAVAISRPAGRLGNHLMQLVQATHVAHELGVDTIYVPSMQWFEIASHASSACGLTYMSYADLEDISVPALFGTFLFEDLEPAASVLDGGLRQRLVERHVSSLFTPPPLRAVRPPNHVAVHLRSGDLFDRPDPHPNFVQPPLAFYTTALSHFAAAQPALHVTLVYEDEGNPVIAALCAFLEGAGVQYSVSSSSVAADLSTLLEHRALVLGRGSFGVAVAALSANVETLYFPWSEARFPGLVRERGLDGYLIEEITPRYIEAGGWTNSVKQRRLMVGYPAENLRAERLR